jgi:predicted Zn-dependent protease
LYTGRSGQSLFSAPDADYFLSCLSRLGITYAMIVDLPLLSTGGPYGNNQTLQKMMENGWIRAHPRIYHKLYSDPEERVEIYGVQAPERWDEAAVLYATALGDLQNSKLPEAEKKLRQALAAVPDFPSALTSLARVRLVRGGGTAEAEKLLRRALALEPDYPRAWELLIRLLENRGRLREAGEARLAAQTALSGTSFEAPL